MPVKATAAIVNNCDLIMPLSKSNATTIHARIAANVLICTLVISFQLLTFFCAITFLCPLMVRPFLKSEMHVMK